MEPTNVKEKQLTITEVTSEMDTLKKRLHELEKIEKQELRKQARAEKKKLNATIKNALGVGIDDATKCIRNWDKIVRAYGVKTDADQEKLLKHLLSETQISYAQSHALGVRVERPKASRVEGGPPAV